jgi:hypothetical protein
MGVSMKSARPRDRDRFASNDRASALTPKGKGGCAPSLGSCPSTTGRWVYALAEPFAVEYALHVLTERAEHKVTTLIRF